MSPIKLEKNANPQVFAKDGLLVVSAGAELPKRCFCCNAPGIEPAKHFHFGGGKGGVANVRTLGAAAGGLAGGALGGAIGGAIGGALTADTGKKKQLIHIKTYLCSRH